MDNRPHTVSRTATSAFLALGAGCRDTFPIAFGAVPGGSVQRILSDPRGTNCGASLASARARVG